MSTALKATLLVVGGNFITAIAIPYAIKIADPNMAHPALEVTITLAVGFAITYFAIRAAGV